MRTLIQTFGNDYHFQFILQRVKHGVKQAKIKQIECNLTVVDLRNLWDLQNGRCYYTDRELNLPVNSESMSIWNSPSIDRIDSSLGYTPENTRMVLKEVNFMKHSSSHEDFLEFCRMIAASN